MNETIYRNARICEARGEQVEPHASRMPDSIRQWATNCLQRNPAVRWSELGGVNIGNKLIKIRQKFLVTFAVVKVSTIALGYCGNKTLEPLSIITQKVVANQLGVLNERWNYVSERASVSIVAPNLQVQSVKLSTPAPQERNKRSAPSDDCALGNLNPLQSLRMQSPTISEPSSRKPTSNRQTDDIRIIHVLVYLLLLAVSSGVAYHIGRTQASKSD